MKKFLALLLTALFLLSVGTCALAAVSSETSPSENKQATFYFNKKYVKTVSETASDTFPAEELSFNVTADASNPSDTLIAIAPQTVDAVNDEIGITIPAYTAVGNYMYTISEVVGDTQGVTYSSESFLVEVMVTYKDNGSGMERQVVFKTANPAEENGKVDTITNRFDTGDLTVKKVVSGNLASTTALFDIIVEFTASPGEVVRSNITYAGGSDASASGTIAPNDWVTAAGQTSSKATVTIKLKADETVTFSHIPEGVHYTVHEDTKHTNPDELNLGDDKGYQVSGEVGNPREIMCDETSHVIITNTKTTGINTGISLDSLPYIIALAVVGVGAVLFLVRRRRREDD